METTVSNDAEGNGRSRASPVLSCTRSSTPSARAFAAAVSGRLVERSSALQTSTPTARPDVRRFAAPMRARPLPQPTSRTCSFPVQYKLPISRSRTRSFPIRLDQNMMVAVSNHEPPHQRPARKKAPAAIGWLFRRMNAVTVPPKSSTTPPMAKARTTPGASIP